MNEDIQKLVYECEAIQDVVSSFVDEAKKGNPEVIERLQTFRHATRDFSQFISTSNTAVDCELPHHRHSIKFRYYQCTINKMHVFCRKHDLDFCPQCGGLVR